MHKISSIYVFCSYFFAHENECGTKLNASASLLFFCKTTRFYAILQKEITLLRASKWLLYINAVGFVRTTIHTKILIESSPWGRSPNPNFALNLILDKFMVKKLSSDIRANGATCVSTVKISIFTLSIAFITDDYQIALNETGESIPNVLMLSEVSCLRTMLFTYWEP